MNLNLPIKEIFNFEKGSLQSSKAVDGEYDFITASSEWKKHNSYEHDKEALIIAVAASGSLGRVHYVNGKFISSDLCFILTPKDQSKFPVDMQFYQNLFCSIRHDLVKSTATGTSKLAINKTNFGNYKVPYFNIDHQKIYKEKFVKLEKNQHIIQSQINNQKTYINNLRLQILQDAIEGKLTKEWREQNPDAQPASELLKKIKQEKEKLIAEKKIKKEKPLPPIEDSEIPFELPQGWVWGKLGNLGKSIIGLTYKPSDIVENGIPVLRSNNIKNGKINYDNLVQVRESIINNKLVEINDILLCARNGSRNLVGKSALITQEKMSFGAFMSLYRSKYFVYIYWFLQSNEFRNQFDDKKSTGICQLTQTTLNNILIPLPPIIEQKAIISKLQSIMHKLDEAEKAIEDSLNTSNLLTKSILAEAFNKK